jgi:hypothetical protein
MMAMPLPFMPGTKALRQEVLIGLNPPRWRIPCG